MNFQAYTLQKHNEWACIQIKAPESESRTPVHLCCVIDTSGSMETDNKLESVKQSLHFLLDFLGPQDKISVITFSENAKTILSQIAVNASERDNIRARISIIRIESNTNLSSGIIQSRESLISEASAMKQGILLLTDGHANLGLTRPADILELVRNTISRFSGTSISSVGYGIEHNTELLQSISTEGGGSYYVVNNLEDVATVFGDILGGLISCSSQQVRVVLPSRTELKSRYANHTADNKMEVVIGDMPAGIEAVFLAKIPSGSSVTLKGYDLQTHSSFEVNSVIRVTEDSTLQVNGQAHFLRFEVLTLIDQCKALLMRLPSMSELTGLLAKINTCIVTITEYKSHHEHSLWDILLDELKNCKNSIENRENNIDSPHIMTQHAGYLGRMRGIAAAMSMSPDDVSEPLGPIPLGRTFSNNAQRQISSQLVASVTPHARRRPRQNSASQQDEPQDPLSLPITPPTRSPVLGGMASPPPLNRIRLVRQVACPTLPVIPSPPPYSQDSE